jgi:transposase InsO family protein
MKMFREGREKEWYKQGRPVVRFQMAERANERWQLDHTRLDIWIRELVKDAWVVREAWCTAAVDAFSRAVAGIVISTKNPDAWTTSILMMMAVQPKRHELWLNRGLPDVIQPDRGADFMSRSVQGVMASLHVVFDPDPPRYPNRKGIVERWFGTLDGFLRTLPGHMKATGTSRVSGERSLSVLLTRNQLKEAIEDWIAVDYHQRPHSELEGRKPVEVWEENVRLRLPEPEQLNALLLKADETRTLRRTGIHFQKETYWAPELVEHWKSEVLVRYNPEDLESVLIYHGSTGDYICEAWIMGKDDSRYGIADVKQSRNQFRRGIVERLRIYSREVEDHDRKVAEKVEWEIARSTAAEALKRDAEEPPACPVQDYETERLLEEFKRLDRGEV